MNPSDVLKLHREDIRRVVEQCDARNPRVFGSVAQGDDSEESDLDFLVDPISGKAAFISLIRIQRAPRDLLGVPVEVQIPGSLFGQFREKVLAEAVPV